MNPRLPVCLLMALAILCAGCASREAEGVRKGLNDAGDEITKAARKVSGAIRGDGH